MGYYTNICNRHIDVLQKNGGKLVFRSVERSISNAPKNPLTSEVDFFPKERVLYEAIEIH